MALLRFGIPYPQQRNSSFLPFLLLFLSSYQSHRFGFLGNDLRQAVSAFAVAEKGFIRQSDLAVCKSLALSPSDILGYRTAFLLRKRGHYRDEQLAFAVEGIDVFLLKINLGAALLELANSGQAVNGVAGKTADGFGDDVSWEACASFTNTDIPA